jgi:LPS sulfotransferase NodH
VGAASLRLPAGRGWREARALVARAWNDLATTVAGHRGYRRFVVVGIARTGSTLVLDLLNAHRNAIAFGELFRSEHEIGWDLPGCAGHRDAGALRDFRTDPSGFLDRHVFRPWPRRVRAVGFKIFHYHARRPPFDAVWQRLREDDAIRVIHVVRGNTLEQYVSLKLAERTGFWSSGDRRPTSEPTVRLDVDDCLRHFDYVDRAGAECRRFFASHPFLEIHFEELAADLAAGARRLHDFLGLPGRPVQSKRRRQQHRPMRDVVVNYAELRAAFDGTRWSGFFDG